MSGLVCEAVVKRWVAIRSWKTSRTCEMCRSECTLWLVTYHGAFVIVLRSLDWYRCIISMLECETQPHSCLCVFVSLYCVLSPTLRSRTHSKPLQPPLNPHRQFCYWLLVQLVFTAVTYISSTLSFRVESHVFSLSAFDRFFMLCLYQSVRSDTVTGCYAEDSFGLHNVIQGLPCPGRLADEMIDPTRS
jgi:hypothetical protein